MQIYKIPATHTPTTYNNNFLVQNASPGLLIISICFSFEQKLSNFIMDFWNVLTLYLFEKPGFLLSKCM